MCNYNSTLCYRLQFIVLHKCFWNDTLWIQCFVTYSFFFFALICGEDYTYISVCAFGKCSYVIKHFIKQYLWDKLSLYLFVQYEEKKTKLSHTSLMEISASMWLSVFSLNTLICIVTSLGTTLTGGPVSAFWTALSSSLFNFRPLQVLLWCQHTFQLQRAFSWV